MEEQIQPVENQMPPVMKKFFKPGFKAVWPYVLGSLLVVLLGVGAGWLLSGGRSKTGTGGTAVSNVKVGSKEAGVEDEANFSHSAEGMLESDGVDGEGTHHLVRDGGPSQTVKLTSTVIDLEGFVGKKVTIWGETITAREGGWLMDVGKIKVVE